MSVSSRYSRQIAVKEIGREGQDKLRAGKVLIIGCGALGSRVAMQLSGAGVGMMGLADFDSIDISNLQRQFFFKTEESGQSKANTLAKRVKDLNPEISVKIYSELITPQKARAIYQEYDFIVDATDNPESKRITGRVSRECGKGCCIGGVRDFSGQVMTFLKDDSRLEEYFGDANAEGFLPCSLSGVFGPAAALCASIQASETLKFLIGSTELLSGQILLFDLLKNKFQKFNL